MARRLDFGATTQYRLGGRGVKSAILTLLLTGRFASAAMVDERAAVARLAIEESESRQRRALGSLFVIDDEMKTAQRRADRLDQRARASERDARRIAIEVRALELRSAERGRQLNSRVTALHRRRANVSAIGALFGAETPAQVDRQQHFLKLLINDDHARIESFVAGLREAKQRRAGLALAVKRLISARRDARAAEITLVEKRRLRAQIVAEMAAKRDQKMAELRDLRAAGAAGELSFVERRGTLGTPVRATVARAYGEVRDARLAFRLLHRGWFFASPGRLDVSAVAGGRVTVARELPGLGPTVVIDHGGHYHSVYSGAARIKVREGDVVDVGAALAQTGAGSPLFGPGLYFELRHFADAIDPRNWIKDPELNVTAPHRE